MSGLLEPVQERGGVDLQSLALKMERINDPSIPGARS